MDIKLNPNLGLIDWTAVSQLFQLVNWDVRKPEDIRASFNQSSVVCFIMDKNEIVAMGRTVDDGKYYALLADVVIHPDYQGQGLGTTIVNTLSSELKGYNFITLTAAPNKEGFYHKIGWKKQKSSFILPVNAKQEKEHCE